MTCGANSPGKPHCIGDECCSHCLPFPDPDYRTDVEGITGKPLVIHPVNTDMTDEELAELIRNQLKMTFKMQEK